MTVEKVIETAKGIISGEIGVVEGSRIIATLRFEVSNQDHDSDFLPFVGIDSESDHIPLGKVREQWSSSGLEKMDAEQAKIEAHYRPWAVEASRKLLERFANDI